MVIEVRPIRGEDPGACQAIDEDGPRCADVSAGSGMSASLGLACGDECYDALSG
jgi:hypothetical protein